MKTIDKLIRWSLPLTAMAVLIGITSGIDKKYVSKMFDGALIIATANAINEGIKYYKYNRKLKNYFT